MLKLCEIIQLARPHSTCTQTLGREPSNASCVYSPHSIWAEFKFALAYFSSVRHANADSPTGAGERQGASRRFLEAEFVRDSPTARALSLTSKQHGAHD